jgi:hypothetical protein
MRDAYPLAIDLPGGRRAEYVSGTRPARYTIDGAPCDLDVTLPADVAAAGWFWSGTWLCDGDIRIYTGTFGVAGVIAQARIHMALQADYAPQPVQLGLFERAA